MLFENDGSASDVVNYYAELFGDGTIMDAMRRKMAREQEGKLTLEQREIAETAARVNECKERRVQNETGIVPDFSAPLRHYHGYAAAFKLKAEEEGIILDNNGYECWADTDFQAWYRKRYPELCFKEAPRNARIIVNESAGAPRKSFTHGGLIAA
jgi:hypothetical protein